jgi:hypothetical protein
MIFALSVSLIVVVVLLVVSVYYNYRFAKIIMKFEDSIAVGLDKLDERYQSISMILEIPVFYDSPQVKKVVSDMQVCRDTILEVANSLAKIEESQDGEEEEI